MVFSVVSVYSITSYDRNVNTQYVIMQLCNYAIMQNDYSILVFILLVKYFISISKNNNNVYYIVILYTSNTNEN